ncbi:MAG: polysaccharide biosynthesis C-terminal domain-containing protein [Saprospiraceae bacterium]|nr:polysaccharide biosynthesis C-terminal domain-containing protein [Saprospiraceae bacterium]
MDSVPIFNTYLLIIASRLIFSRTVLIGLQDNKVVLWISVVDLLTNVIVSIWFISLWGLTGVALATVVAYSLEKALICAYLHKKHQIPVGAYTDLRWWSGYSIILLAVYFIIQGT